MESASTRLLAKFESLKVWRAGDQRAPHKPLLAVWAIGRALAGEPRLAPFAEADRALRALLRDFGPHRARPHTEYPFWRLRKDGLWEVEGVDLVTTTSNGDAHRRSLLEHNVHGGFPEAVHAALSADEDLAKQIAHALVDAHFPESLHGEILHAAGIEPAYVTMRRLPRDPRFPERVLEAYGHRCAVCGFAVRLNEKPIGLEAAHIKWHGARSRARRRDLRTRSRSARSTIASSTRGPSRSDHRGRSSSPRKRPEPATRERARAVPLETHRTAGTPRRCARPGLRGLAHPRGVRTARLPPRRAERLLTLTRQELKTSRKVGLQRTSKVAERLTDAPSRAPSALPLRTSRRGPHQLIRTMVQAHLLGIVR